MIEPVQMTTAEIVHALDLLEAGKNLFLTGKAGTGKSTLVRRFLAQTSRRAVTVAPTGIAALTVDGYTIHRLFSFPVGVSVEAVRSSRYFPGRFAKVLSQLDTLIVDEISMVRADLFDAMTAALERFGPKPGEPFGGVQLVLVGDLYQLPPVVNQTEASYFEETFDTPFFFSAKSFDREKFPTIELTTVFRQGGDRKLVSLLNAVREGALLEDARAELNQRTKYNFEPDMDEFWLTLATTNRIVRARNREMLERLSACPRRFAAQITGDTDGFEFPTEEQLELTVGAQVMLLNNDGSDRWVNGSIGRVFDIRQDDGEPVIDVLLRDGRIVEVRYHLWEITQPVIRGGILEHEVIGTFCQLPMKLAWAITIHKSQGQTLDRVIVDLTGGTFANGQLYVALSRCTSLEGLVLKRDVLPRDLKTDIRVRRFLTSHSSAEASLGEVYIAVLTVGKEGDRYRPRPIEIAVVTDEGDQATTVVNPTSDLYNAESEFGITTRDVQLAPVLTEAWAALTPLLAGRVPVGVRIDSTLSLIDSELKRNGNVERMPLGVEIPDSVLNQSERQGLAAPTALERACAMRSATTRLRESSPKHGGAGGGSPFSLQPCGRGFLLSRTTGASGSSDPRNFVVGGNLQTEEDPAGVLADLLVSVWERVVDRDEAVVERLHRVEEYFEIQILPEDLVVEERIDIESSLTPGARVCFTGTVHIPERGEVTREEMKYLACQRGLVISENMTKTKTDVLVAAQRGTQSGKAKKAAQWGKPVISAEEFLDWANR